jgi:hypothetical protein
MDDKKNTEIIDISKKARIIPIVAFFIPLVLGILFVDDTKENAAILILLAFVSSWLSSYLLERGKIVLRVGSFIDKDNRFYLLNNGKKIDSLRIRREEDVSEQEILSRFEKFLIKNNLKQYKKIYLMGSSSKEDIGIVRNALNR